MTLLTLVVTMLVAAGPAEKPALVVQASDSPVRLDHATILSGADGPPVLLFAATNLTEGELDTFTVIAFIFNANGTLKARQMAPARRTLDARSTKYSTIVLDGFPIGPTDLVVVGVNQAQAINSDVWWRADIQAAAEAAAQRKKP